MMTNNKRLIAALLIPAALLLVPFIAMKFTDEVKWTSIDFVAAAIMLYGAAILIELVMRFTANFRLRAILSGAILIILFLVWAELAVGIFGTRFAGS